MNLGNYVDSERQIDTAAGQLHCRITRPTSNAWARLLIIHGYGEHIGRYRGFMHWLAARGAICQGIDLRGHGRSTGRRGFVRKWDEYLHDVRAFLDSSLKEAGDENHLPLFILGHSHGGLIVAAAGERGVLNDVGVRGCVLASPYLATLVPPPARKRAIALAANKIVPWLRVKSNLRPEWLTRDLQMLAEDKTDALMNRSATPRWFFTMRATQLEVRNETANFALPLLCLAGDADLIADPAATADFYQHASSPDKSLYMYPSHVHELLREVKKETIFADILTWLKARSKG